LNGKKRGERSHPLTLKEERLSGRERKKGKELFIPLRKKLPLSLEYLRKKRGDRDTKSFTFGGEKKRGKYGPLFWTAAWPR